MRKKRSLQALAAVLFACCGYSPAWADGKFFPRDEVPLDLPYQRAILFHDGTEEILIIQPKFEGKADEFGWVVPLPAVPEVASIPEKQAYRAFRRLSWISQPDIVFISDCVRVLGALLALFVLVLFIFSERRKGRLRLSRLILSVALAGAITVVLLLPGMLGHRVDILSEASTGSYDVKVIKGESGKDIQGWLRERGYRFSSEDQAVFQDYVEKGWCFVTARVSPGREKSFLSGEGLVNPLVFRFASKDPVYPLILTGTAGKPVMFHLYVFAETKVRTGGRLKMEYAKHVGEVLDPDMLETDPPDFLKGGDLHPPYLTKFAGTLAPEEMKEDLAMTVDPDEKPYRKTVYRW